MDNSAIDADMVDGGQPFGCDGRFPFKTELRIRSYSEHLCDSQLEQQKEQLVIMLTAYKYRDKKEKKSILKDITPPLPLPR